MGGGGGVHWRSGITGSVRSGGAGRDGVVIVGSGCSCDVALSSLATARFASHDVGAAFHAGAAPAGAALTTITVTQSSRPVLHTTSLPPIPSPLSLPLARSHTAARCALAPCTIALRRYLAARYRHRNRHQAAVVTAQKRSMCR